MYEFIALSVLFFAIKASSIDPKVAGLHLVDNQIFNSLNEPIRLRGVDYSGFEFMCIQGHGIAPRGGSGQEIIDAFKSWDAAIIRIPLNEDCWLNKNVLPQYGGKNYQKTLEDFVHLLGENGLAVVLDLHWTAPGNEIANSQKPMPDKDNSVQFWKEMAYTFQNTSHVIFDIFNEPFANIGAPSARAAWECWKTGFCPWINYQVAGMDELVRTVRSTRSQNICLLGGLNWSNDLSGWLTYRPREKDVAASWHSYSFNACNNQACWMSTVEPIMKAGYYVIVTEFGQPNCTRDYVDGLISWMNNQQMSYIGWTFNDWDCSSGPSLVKNWKGDPTEYGLALYHALKN